MIESASSSLSRFDEAGVYRNARPHFLNGFMLAADDSILMPKFLVLTILFEGLRVSEMRF